MKLEGKCVFGVTFRTAAEEKYLYVCTLCISWPFYHWNYVQDVCTTEILRI